MSSAEIFTQSAKRKKRQRSGGVGRDTIISLNILKLDFLPYLS